MTKLNEIKKALGKILFNFAEMVVGEVTYVYESLEVGTDVFVYDAEGQKMPAPDATFESDGSTIVIAGGKFESITPIEPAVKLEETPTEPEIVEVVVEVVNPLEQRITDLETKFTELLAVVNGTVEAVEEFASQEVGEKIKPKKTFSGVETKGAARFFSKQ